VVKYTYMRQIKAVTYGTGLPEFNSKPKQKYVKQSRLFIYEESGASSQGAVCRAKWIVMSELRH
jgi:hypothetical protein